MNDPGILVNPAWLSGHVKHPGVVVVDVRWSPRGGPTVAKREFEDGHIPGAGFVDIDQDLAGKPFVSGPGRHPLPDADGFALKMASLGIDDDMVVVAYDPVGGSLAARLWWMLWVTGHQVALLDGGIQAWRLQGGDLEMGPMKRREPSLFTAVPWPTDRIATAGAVESTIRAGAAPVLDARIPERYRGDREPIDPVAGHIPGARSAPWTGNLNADGSFRTADELRARYAELGVTNDAAVASCGSGVTACHDLFAINLAGFGDARLYEGSYSDWVSDPDRPVAQGDDPG